uniref:hypothetical protein n=1 Tax=Pseudomonas sp. TaxID=306 RepID=UPI00257AD57E
MRTAGFFDDASVTRQPRSQPKRARVTAYVELVGDADHCETCLLLVIARLSSDVERTREACYAFRCG